MLPLSHTSRVRPAAAKTLPYRPVHCNSKYLRRYALCRRLKPGRGIVNSRVVLLLRSVEIKPLSYCMLLEVHSCISDNAPPPPPPFCPNIYVYMYVYTQVHICKYIQPFFFSFSHSQSSETLFQPLMQLQPGVAARLVYLPNNHAARLSTWPLDQGFFFCQGPQKKLSTKFNPQRFLVPGAHMHPGSPTNELPPRSVF